MNRIQIGYARVSTDQDSPRSATRCYGWESPIRTSTRSRTDRHQPARPGLREAPAAVRTGDTLVVTKLDRLARSVKDARDIADELTTKGVALNLGGSRYDPTDPVGRLLFNVLAMVAEFERDLISMRTKEGMAVARAKGHLKGRYSRPRPDATPHHALSAQGWTRAAPERTRPSSAWAVIECPELHAKEYKSIRCVEVRGGQPLLLALHCTTRQAREHPICWASVRI
ncbi:recombinase family protein [Microbacterium sp. NPDC055910]|uniref:recombinase family protein n=1 Tax=Microbacterium sp. NPDC055910 TaxID=3345659 RepID=UPI0035E39AB8